MLGGRSGTKLQLLRIETYPPPLESARAEGQGELGQLCEHSFNSVLLNYYRDESDSVSWHADDDTELGPNPIVASVSLGAERMLELKPKFNLKTRTSRWCSAIAAY